MPRSGPAILSIGRAESDASPVSVNVPSWNASRPTTSRASVPALPQSISAARRPRRPTPCTTSSSPSSSTRAPSARTACSVDSVSPERPHPWTRVSPSATAPSRSARCETDLSPGTARWPSSAAAGSTFIDHRRDDDAVALALEQVGRSLGLAGSGDEHGQRAAALGRDVVQLEVLDVDALGAERLGDACEHAGPIGHVHAEAVEVAGVRVLAVEHPPPALRRLADPAREEAGVTLRERGLDLLDAPAVLRELGSDALGVVEEDVD